jgi:hypothetical protein
MTCGLSHASILHAHSFFPLHSLIFFSLLL